ncbi:MAG: class I tRNA ligase family protein, partial [Gemmobacter sp.]
MAVISLSSIPSRFAALERVLPALVAQDIGDVAIELYLPRRYRRFPDHDGTLPRVPPGVEIVRVDEDLGPATKILHAVERHRRADTPILYCDDDVLYAPGWARGLIEAQRAHPFAAVAAAGMNLDALGLPLPRTVHGHGWVHIGKQKMSKSLGNVVEPNALAEQFGADALRYYL